MAMDHLLVCPALYFGGGRLAERARPWVVLASGPAFRATVLVGCNIGIGIVEIPPPDQGEVRWGSSGFVSIRQSTIVFNVTGHQLASSISVPLCEVDF